MFFFFFLSIYIKISIFTTGNCFFVSKRLQINILIYPIILQFMWIYYSFIIFFTIEVEKRYRIINNFGTRIVL